jgi:hypothetical protein
MPIIVLTHAPYPKSKDETQEQRDQPGGGDREGTMRELTFAVLPPLQGKGGLGGRRKPHQCTWKYAGADEGR